MQMPEIFIIPLIIEIGIEILLTKVQSRRRLKPRGQSIRRENKGRCIEAKFTATRQFRIFSFTDLVERQSQTSSEHFRFQTSGVLAECHHAARLADGDGYRSAGAARAGEALLITRSFFEEWASASKCLLISLG
jgi:hypothetical protein